jgi:cell division protein FtsB
MAGTKKARTTTPRATRRPAAGVASRPRVRSRTTGRARNRGPARSPVQIKVGRLGVLVLLLIAAALYVSPLRAFFAQQDRYTHAVAQLDQARGTNAALKAEVVKIDTTQYILEMAREQFQLVPSGMQAFVVTGLPAEKQPAMPDAQPQTGSLSLPQRLVDLWRTLLH